MNDAPEIGEVSIAKGFEIFPTLVFSSLVSN